MVLYGLYYKETSERVFKLDNIVADDPVDKIEAANPIVARINFVRKLKIAFKEFQKLYSVKRIANLDSLDIKQRENILLAAALEEGTVIAPYEDRSKIRTQEAIKRNQGLATEIVNRDFNPHMMYDPKTEIGTMANSYEEHLRLTALGYTHDKPVVKRITKESITLEVTPQQTSDPTREDLLEEKRSSKRNINNTRYRTEEDNRKRVEEKTNPFSSKAKFGPRKKINPVQRSATPNKSIITKEDTVVENITEETIIEDPGTISYPSSGGGSFSGGSSGGGGGGY